MIREHGSGLTGSSAKIASLLTNYAEEAEKVIYAEPWIDASSIVLIENITLNISIRDTSVEDATIIRNALNSLGYLNFEITQV